MSGLVYSNLEKAKLVFAGDIKPSSTHSQESKNKWKSNRSKK